MHYGLITILGGILAASSWIIAKKPDAKQLIDKMVPYQGWLGVVLFVYGIWGVLGSLSFLSYRYGLFLLLASAADILVGFILGFALISKYALSKNEAAMKKGEELRGKLLKYQIPLGFAAMILGVLYLVVFYM